MIIFRRAAAQSPSTRIMAPAMVQEPYTAYRWTLASASHRRRRAKVLLTGAEGWCVALALGALLFEILPYV